MRLAVLTTRDAAGDVRKQALEAGVNLARLEALHDRGLALHRQQGVRHKSRGCLRRWRMRPRAPDGSPWGAAPCVPSVQADPSSFPKSMLWRRCGRKRMSTRLPADTRPRPLPRPGRALRRRPVRTGVPDSRHQRGAWPTATLAIAAYQRLIRSRPSQALDTDQRGPEGVLGLPAKPYGHPWRLPPVPRASTCAPLQPVSKAQAAMRSTGTLVGRAGPVPAKHLSRSPASQPHQVPLDATRGEPDVGVGVAQ